jgi:hypothetical protein
MGACIEDEWSSPLEAEPNRNGPKLQADARS